MEGTRLRRRSTRQVIVLSLVALATIPPVPARQAQKAEKPFARILDLVQGSGKDAELPPQLSRQLGHATKLQSVDVKQIAYPLKGTNVTAFNVSVRNHEDMVIFRVTET